MAAMLLVVIAPDANALFVSQWFRLPALDPTAYIVVPRFVNNNGVVAGDPPAAGTAQLVYDPRTGSSTRIELDGLTGNVVGLNDRDQLVGFVISNGGPRFAKAFLKDLRTDVLRVFEGPDGFARAVGINAPGTVVGQYGDLTDSMQAWYWRPGDPAPTVITDLGGGGMLVNDINDSGQFVGVGRLADGTWRPYLHDIRDGTTVVGGPILPAGQGGTLVDAAGRVFGPAAIGNGGWYWSLTSLQAHELPGPPFAVSDNGFVLMYTPSDPHRTSIYDLASGSSTPMSFPGDRGARGVAMNARGDVIGAIEIADHVVHVGYWERGSAIGTDLGMAAGYASGSGQALNESGQVTATLTQPNGVNEGFLAALAAPVPPTTSTGPSSSTAATPAASATTPSVTAVPSFTG